MTSYKVLRADKGLSLCTKRLDIPRVEKRTSVNLLGISVWFLSRSSTSLTGPGKGASTRDLCVALIIDTAFVLRCCPRCLRVLASPGLSSFGSKHEHSSSTKFTQNTLWDVLGRVVRMAFCVPPFVWFEATV